MHNFVKCEGLVNKDSLESNNLYIDADNYCINNLNDGSTHRLGDEVMVRVSGVNMTKRQIDFNIIL